MKESEDLDFDLDSSTNTTSQPSLVEESILRSKDVKPVFAEYPHSDARVSCAVYTVFRCISLTFLNKICIHFLDQSRQGSK